MTDFFDHRITLPQVFLALWCNAWLNFWGWLGEAVFETTRMMLETGGAA